jgi:hypothetical protein
MCTYICVYTYIYIYILYVHQGDAFGFMKLCALIITELKNLSAASRANPQGIFICIYMHSTYLYVRIYVHIYTYAFVHKHMYIRIDYYGIEEPLAPLPKEIITWIM